MLIKNYEQYPDTPIKHRYDFSILFDVENGNPNGDPDAGGMPRVDPETEFGIVTDVCIKRKIRQAVEQMSKSFPEGKQGYEIYVKKRVPLSRQDMKAIHYLGVDPNDIAASKKDDPELDRKLMAFMCNNFYDIRTFGSVMTTFVKNNLNCGQVRGPVQLTFGRSIDQVLPQEVVITRVTKTTEDDAKNKKGDSEMGRKYIIPYALYRMNGFISPNLAQQVTGFSERDLAIFWDAIMDMFQFDRSASRGFMSLRKLVIFEHENAYGRAPSNKLFDLLEVKKKPDVIVPRKYFDYDVSLGEAPQGVSVTVREV